jgi:hypothetical protein
MSDEGPSTDDEHEIIRQYVNELTPEEQVEWMDDNMCLVELAWLRSTVDSLEKDIDMKISQIRVAHSLAYAHARGEIKHIRLILPGVENPE